MSTTFWGLTNDKHDEMAEAIRRKLPHGSGIDADWDVTRRKDGKWVCRNSFHMMNDMGYYVGWQDFTVKLDKDGKLVDVQLNGGHSYQARQSMLLDYLYDVFSYEFS